MKSVAALVNACLREIHAVKTTAATLASAAAMTAATILVLKLAVQTVALATRAIRAAVGIAVSRGMYARMASVLREKVTGCVSVSVAMELSLRSFRSRSFQYFNDLFPLQYLKSHHIVVTKNLSFIQIVQSLHRVDSSVQSNVAKHRSMVRQIQSIIIYIRANFERLRRPAPI